MILKHKKRKIGIELGHFSFKIVKLKEEDNKIIENYGIFEHNFSFDITPFKDSGIHEYKKIISFLKEKFKDMKLKGGDVGVVIPDSFTFSKILSIKNTISPDEMLLEINKKLQTILPIPIENFQISSQVIGNFNNNNLVIVEAINKNHLFEIDRIIRKLNFNPVLIDGSTFSAQNFMSYYLDSPDNKDKNIALFNVGYKDFTCMLFKNGELRVILNKPIGIFGMISALVRKKQISIKEAIKIITDDIIFLPEIAEEQENIQNYIAIKDWLFELIRHIFAFFEYYFDKFHETTIDEIIMFGGGTNIENFPLFLGAQLNVNVLTASDIFSIKVSNKILKSHETNIIIPAVSAANRLK